LTPDLAETFDRAARILDQSGVEWWLSDGTALSCVREGKFEPWQKDCDFGVWSEDLPGVRKMFERKGYRSRHEVADQFKADGMLDIKGHRRRGAHVDCVFMEGSHKIHPEGVVYRFPAHLFDFFDLYPFHGRQVRLPSPAEEYLTVHYGDWRTPVKEWQWDRDAACIVR
jgi:phosphorylcholine metabolism protein LicD